MYQMLNTRTSTGAKNLIIVIFVSTSPRPANSSAVSSRPPDSSLQVHVLSSVWHCDSYQCLPFIRLHVLIVVVQVEYLHMIRSS